uniref:Doubled CXXCH domain-containing protein n=1 Tax=Candidatus Kentrum sp. DK TaxID=2126562 RepID=A0A450T8V2_9GAMM|nr:MAG: hypothetical protein BECKDK2373B_GA0170837_111912 [Candidatus Kentron sp. DK]
MKRLSRAISLFLVSSMIAAAGMASPPETVTKTTAVPGNASPATGGAPSGAWAPDGAVAPFSGYAGAPDFEIVPRKANLRLYPCRTCHRFLPDKPVPRKLVTALPHPNMLRHGKGRLWCLDCHDRGNKDFLYTLRGGGANYDQEHLVCGQCHYERHRDWYFGAHGKRMNNWRGKRVIVLCSHCHNPHDPVITPRRPRESPPVRRGLAPPPERAPFDRSILK